MKTQWNNPKLQKLNLDYTNATEYVDFCSWSPIIDFLGNGNEDYTDQSNKPAQHPDWVWCSVHKRWHSKNHTKES